MGLMLDQINNDFSEVNKKYVDEVLQANYDLEFIKDFNGANGSVTVNYALDDSNIQFFVFVARFGSGNNFYASTIIPARDFWLKKQFFIPMSGVIATSDARYSDILYVNSNTVQVRNYNSTLTGTFYACKKKLATNALAYTTTDILWSGSANSGNITLSQPIGNYDYIEFQVAGGSSLSGAFPILYRFKVSDLINPWGNQHFIMNISWDTSINRYIFINGTLTKSSTTIPLSWGAQSILVQVRGLRVVQEKDFPIKKMIVSNLSTDGNGYLPYQTLPAGAALIGGRIVDKPSSLTGTMLLLPNQNTNNLTQWNFQIRNWDFNIHSNKSGLTVEFLYVE